MFWTRPASQAASNCACRSVYAHRPVRTALRVSSYRQVVAQARVSFGSSRTNCPPCDDAHDLLRRKPWKNNIQVTSCCESTRRRVHTAHAAGNELHIGDSRSGFTTIVGANRGILRGVTQSFPAVPCIKKTNVSGTRVASSFVDERTGFPQGPAKAPRRGSPRPEQETRENFRPQGRSQ